MISPIKHEILSDSSCGGVKPTGETQRSCNEINCPAKWRASAWSKVQSVNNSRNDIRQYAVVKGFSFLQLNSSNINTITNGNDDNDDDDDDDDDDDK